MKRILFLIIILIMISCINNNKVSEPIKSSDISFMVIDCPCEVKVGETVLVKAIAYDKDNNRITGNKIVCPNWLIDDKTLVEVKKIDGDCMIIFAKKEGVINIQAINGDIVSTARIIVKK